jgi:ABC-type histidine transport system ATPase subunit
MRLHAMFSRQYQGDFHKLFVGALDDYQKLYNPQKHFGRIIPIIQSSGTGKSRLVRQIAYEVCYPSR